MKQLNITVVLLLSYPGHCRIQDPATLHLREQTHSQAQLKQGYHLNVRATMYLRDHPTQLPPLDKETETEIKQLAGSLTAGW